VSPLFLLDTDVVSNLRKAKPHPNLVSWLQSVAPASVFMAAATIAEIQCDIGLINVPAAAQRAQDWLDGMLRDGQPRIANFGARAAVLLGRMWATPALNNFIANDPRSRKVKSGADLAIAATAMAQYLVVVTGNVDNFLLISKAFPLPGLFNPFNGHWAVETTAEAGSPR
jgi:predicted nucleic acid-binding protein